MGTKVLVGVLIGVVALFVGAVVLGARGEEGDASGDQGGVIGVLLDRFRDQSSVRRGEIGGDCGPVQADGTLQVTAGCRLQVRPSDQRIRLLRLRAESPVTVSARTPDDSGRTVKSELDAGEDLEVAVRSEGSAVSVGCRVLGPCVVRLLGGS